jgi:SAM-dependent methyltransferase
MSDEQPQGRPHSAAFLGRERDFWWNLDHLELIASRLKLGGVRSVLDVGAGIGHWGILLSEVLSPDATLIGVEREAAWVKEATSRAERLGLSDRFRYEQGEAEALAFEDASFDLVTCQTLLIHVPDPRRVIHEMLRVAKSGGLIVAAEPNNRASLLVETSANSDASIDDPVDLVRFSLTCERGKTALGEGNGSVGDLLPGYFAQCGIVGIETFLSDKVSAMVPPYASDEQQVLKTKLLEDADRGSFGWTRDETKRFFVAGGGSEEDFDAAWERRLAESRSIAAAIEQGTFHTAGGVIHYVVSGRRPG